MKILEQGLLTYRILLVLVLGSAGANGQLWNNRDGLDSMLRLLHLSKEDTSKSLTQEFISYCYLNINPDSAFYYAREEMSTARAIGWKKGIANGYADLGNCFHVKGDYSTALECYYKGLLIYEELNFKYGESNLANNIATIVYSQNQYDEALRYYHKSLYIKKQMIDSTFLYAGNAVTLYNEYSNVGSVYVQKGDYEKALYYYGESTKDAKLHRNPDALMSSLMGASQVHSGQGKYGICLNELHQALSIAIENESVREQASIYAELGDSHLAIAKDSVLISDKNIRKGEKANLDIAIDYLKKGLEISNSIGLMDLMKSQFKTLSAAFEMQGNYKESLSAFRRNTELRDTLYNAENGEKIHTIETKREMDLKNKDIKIASLEVEKKRNERGFFIAGIVALIIAMVLFIKSIQRKKLQEQKAAQLKTMIDTQESERKRISRDLHDDIGTKLSALGLFLSSMKEKAVKSENTEIILLAQSSQQFITEAVYDLRELLLDLSPSVLEDFGYTVAVEGLVNKINETRLIHFNLVIFGMTERLRENYELALYRITQELVNNVLKHSDAKKVTLQIGLRENLLILMIEDDGKGFDMSVNQEGYGLKNLNSRTALLEGKITIDAAPGGGTSVLIEVPYKN